MQVALEELPAKGIQSNRPTSFSNAGVGVSYVLDVLRWIPYGGVLLEGYSANGGTVQGPSIAVGGAIALGLDYAFNRDGHRISAALSVLQDQRLPYLLAAAAPRGDRLGVLSHG